MTTRALSRVDSGLASILVAGFLGLGLIFVAGFVDAAGLHAAAHDGRHAISFPCH